MKEKERDTTLKNKKPSTLVAGFLFSEETMIIFSRPF